jgi:hypothetical protein
VQNLSLGNEAHVQTTLGGVATCSLHPQAFGASPIKLSALDQRVPRTYRVNVGVSGKLLLWNERLSRRADASNLNYHLTVLRP